MNNLTLSQVINADFHLRNEPVIRPFGGSFVAADPSLLTPDKSPDGLWHLFFHTTFGVWRFTSRDGIDFKKGEKLLRRAMRPDINLIDGKYVLFFEHTRSLAANALNLINITKWKSEICACESEDLINWSQPVTALSHTKDFEKSPRGVSLSNPFFLPAGEKYRLYYSCGLTYIKDCGFCEPTYVSFAESDCPVTGYKAAEKPVISPDKDKPYLNLCSGCLKVYKLKDGYLGIQNGIYEEKGESRSAIMMLSSENGLDFKFERILIKPSDKPENRWMAQFVYASHLVYFENKLRLYFNARDTSNPIKGRECIGFSEAKI